MGKRIPPTLEAKVFNVALGSVLKAERKRKNIRQKILARNTGHSPNMINALESGKVQFTAFKLHQVCRKLDVDATDMFDRALELIAQTREELKNANQTI